MLEHVRESEFEKSHVSSRFQQLQGRVHVHRLLKIGTDFTMRSNVT